MNRMHTVRSPSRSGLYILLSLFLLLDLGYSALQHYHQPLDGDVAWNLVPEPSVAHVLGHPFGTLAWRGNVTYPNPNRFFCHWSFRTYFLRAPSALHPFADPVSSVYLAAGLARTVTHLLLLLLLARAICGHWRVRSLAFLGAAALLTAFFQTNGYRSHIGIVDPSVTYTFFYALPAAVLLVYLMPFVDRIFHGRRGPLSPVRTYTLAVLAPVVCLSGPLNPAAVGVLTVLALGFLRSGTFRLPLRYLMLWGWVAALAAYSLWLGSYNSLTVDNQLPLVERYARLPEGVFRQFTTKLAWPLLFAGLAANYALLRHHGKRWARAYPAALSFILLYLLLLPLGGYREYRDLVLRYDTILPVTLTCLWLYGGGTLALLRMLSGRRRLAYLVLPVTLAVVFSLADRPELRSEDCERDALYAIAASPRDTVSLSVDCPVLDWTTHQEPAASALNAELLYRWGITDHPKLYYQLPH